MSDFRLRTARVPQNACLRRRHHSSAGLRDWTVQRPQEPVQLMHLGGIVYLEFPPEFCCLMKTSTGEIQPAKLGVPSNHKPTTPR